MMMMSTWVCKCKQDEGRATGQILSDGWGSQTHAVDDDGDYAGDDDDDNYDADDNYDGDANCDYDQDYECWVNQLHLMQC